MKRIFRRYKIPFLISLVVGLAIIVFGGETLWVNAMLAFLGAFLGMVFPDFEYIVFAYLIDPSNELSRAIKGYLGRKNIRGFISFLNEKEYMFGEMSIHSALFQILLVFFLFYVSTAQVWVFALALMLSMYANLVYSSLIEFSKTKTLERWFWFFNSKLSSRGYTFYLVLMTLLLFVQFAFL